MPAAAPAPGAAEADGTDRVAAVRAFNRFYTARIGVLRDGLLRTPHSLTEARVLYELGQREVTEVADLRREMDIDAGFLSRLLARLQRDGLVARERSTDDARRQRIRLTEEGTAAFAELDRRSADEIGAVLDALSDDDQRRLVAAMDTVHELLTQAPPAAGFVLRAPRPGDLGWIVGAHGRLYAEQYSWDESFEALVAGIVADYAKNRDPRREAAWIAEVDGGPAGCVLCVRREEDVAQLRLLLVDQRARGRGIGGRLIEECLRFAQRSGYERITLWTNDILHEARRLYERAGFELVESAPHHSFGHDLVEQTWARAL
ncbi:MAG TPA: bifunctional helix-turn-helix transcriptional regulator/GNAT family N-acetyltransferase [Solirubrobacteraceae bacterium]